MSFQIKNFPEIVTDEIESIRGLTALLTDFNVGSVIRSILEAHAVSIEDLYMAMYTNLSEAIPTAIYTAFNFGRLPATYASGRLVFTFESPVVADTTIPAGSKYKPTGSELEYETAEDLVIESGDNVGHVTVVCTTIGAVGNTLADSILEIVSDSGVERMSPYSVTNPLPLVNGRDEENDISRKSRFIEFVSSFSRATSIALTYAAKLAIIYDNAGNIDEYVTRVGILEERPGRVKIYIASGAEAPTAELVARCQEIIDGYTDTDGNVIAGYSAAGVLVTVHGTTPLLIPLTATIYLESGYNITDVSVDLIGAFDQFLTTVDPGHILYRSGIISALSAVPGVAGVDLVAPATNTTIPIDSSAYRGTTTLIAG